MSGFERGLVSVVLPVHNRPRLVAEAAESVAGQTYRAVELIVVDDGSTDGTPEACRGIVARSPLPARLVRQERRGPGGARETGRLLARGEFIQYLDSDDLLHPLKLEMQVAALARRPSAGIAYGITREYAIGSEPASEASRRTGEDLRRLFPFLLSGRCWHTITPLYRRSVAERIGPWSALIQEEDLEYDARTASLGVELTWCPELVADHRHHRGARAGGGSLADPERMRARIEARRRVLALARSAGVNASDPHYRLFVRELFLLARQCGAAGLTAESRQWLSLARSATRGGRTAIELSVYGLATRIVGEEAAGKIAAGIDRLRSIGGSR